MQKFNQRDFLTRITLEGDPQDPSDPLDLIHLNFRKGRKWSFSSALSNYRADYVSLKS